MRKALRLSLTLLFALSVITLASVPQVLAGGSANNRLLATVTGSVRDNKGNPLAGAVVSLIKDGANQIAKETRSAPDGSFTARIAPGRYSVRAIADGFSEVLFPSAQINPSDQLVYRFNLEPVGQGRTAPERRNDRDNVKWRLRSANSRRSIFQAGEGEDETVNAVIESEEAANVDGIDVAVTPTEAEESQKPVRTQGVFETYAAASANPFASNYTSVNFAVAQPAGENLNLIFAGQFGRGEGAPQRLEGLVQWNASDRHRVSMSLGGARIGTNAMTGDSSSVGQLGQLSVRAVDEWVVRDGVVIVMGLDYSRFVGASNAHSITPRLGIQFDANSRTRLRAAYAPGIERNGVQSSAVFEDGGINFKQPLAEPVALVDGRAVMERSRRFEFGVERVLDNKSSVEATAFFDTTTGRGVGLLSLPLNAFEGESGESLINVANQQGNARGMRVVYSRRINKVLSAQGGYSFGRGQRLSPAGITKPSDLFSNGFFQTAALQMEADFGKGTRIRTVFRFSPDATVFAIDPFAGRLAVFDPSLSIQVTQELPTFGLPVRAEAVIDAHNLFDSQTNTENGETLMQLINARRTVRGGISVRF
ncbi:MAG: carboxypeptidase regulatory-like domain-containing protein [Pyrinomonadaceae bacterium]